VARNDWQPYPRGKDCSPQVSRGCQEMEDCQNMNQILQQLTSFQQLIEHVRQNFPYIQIEEY